jgi:hypothetical protein
MPKLLPVRSLACSQRRPHASQPWPANNQLQPAEASHSRSSAIHGGRGIRDRLYGGASRKHGFRNLVVSSHFPRGLLQPNPLPLIYPRGIQPPQEFWQFSVWFLHTFWRTSGNPCDVKFWLVFAQKRWFPPRRRPTVVFRGWTEPWTFWVGPPWVGPLGPVGHLGGPGTRGPSVARFGPFLGRFRPFLARFRRALHLDTMPNSSFCAACTSMRV